MEKIWDETNNNLISLHEFALKSGPIINEISVKCCEILFVKLKKFGAIFFLQTHQNQFDELLDLNLTVYFFVKNLVMEGGTIPTSAPIPTPKFLRVTLFLATD